MPVLVICKYEQDPIKTEGAIMSTTFFYSAQGQVTNSQWTWLEFEFVQDFMAVLVTSMFDDNKK